MSRGQVIQVQLVGQSFSVTHAETPVLSKVLTCYGERNVNAAIATLTSTVQPLLLHTFKTQIPQSKTGMKWTIPISSYNRIKGGGMVSICTRGIMQ